MIVIDFGKGDAVAIVKYDDVKEKPSTLRAMTSLEREEFEELCVGFGEAWERHRQAVGYDASPGGRPPQLAAIEDKLLFILFYLKTYPLQEVQGHWFGLSQGQANLWIHRLSDVLKEALRCHIVKDVFRNTLLGYADTVMELACGLHNFRSYCRLENY